MLTRAFCILSVLGALAIQAAPASAQTFDLTGFWKSNTAVEVYRVRQIDNRFYWMVDGIPQRGYANVFVGLISGNMIVGQWVDMPGSPRLGNSTTTLALRIESNDRFVKQSETGSPYNGSIWTRVSSPTVAPPVNTSSNTTTSVIPPVVAPPTIDPNARPTDWDSRPQFDAINSGQLKIGQSAIYNCPAMPPNRQAAARVWGTGPYDSSSFICDAALHSGVITAQGGSFTVTVTGPLAPSRAGEFKNGVESFPLGFATQNSISFSR
jgi:hypothetical protein